MDRCRRPGWRHVLVGGEGLLPTQVTPSPPICVKVLVAVGHPVGHVVAARCLPRRDPQAPRVLVLRAAALQEPGARSPCPPSARHRALTGFDDGDACVHARDDVDTPSFFRRLAMALAMMAGVRSALARAAASSGWGWAWTIRRLRSSSSGSSNLPSTLGARRRASCTALL